MPRSQFPLKSHSNMKIFISIWWGKSYSKQHIIHNVWNFWCNFDEWQFFRLKIYSNSFLTCVWVCLWHPTRIYAKVLTHSKPQKPRDRLFYSLICCDWWKQCNFKNALKSFFMFVIYWLSNYRELVGQLKNVYIYLLNFINENYQH